MGLYTNFLVNIIEQYVKNCSSVQLKVFTNEALPLAEAELRMALKIIRVRSRRRRLRYNVSKSPST